MSTIQRANKIELDLNDQQTAASKKHAGAAPWAYNWGLQREQEAYAATGGSPFAPDLHRELNARKGTAVPLRYEVSKFAPQEALRNRDHASVHLYRRAQLKRQGKHHRKIGCRKRKIKKKGLGSFRLTGSLVVVPTAIQSPRLGHLCLTEHGYLPASGVNVLSATVSEPAGHWYGPLRAEQDWDMPLSTGPSVGVDPAIKILVTLSDGTAIANTRPPRRQLKKLKRLQRAVSRKQKGSTCRKKAAGKPAKRLRNATNQRANTLHQVTTMLARTKPVVVMEDLNVSGLLTNHHPVHVIADVGFAEFRQQLTCTAMWYGSREAVASRWELSSKVCSGCGCINKELARANRELQCWNCGLVIDRDLSAAIKLAYLAGSSSDSQNACGGESTDRGREATVKLSSVKQKTRPQLGVP